MPAEVVVDHWNPSQKKKYRFETVCHGAKSRALYRAGAKRVAPGRKGMAYSGKDWVDEDATSHRGLDGRGKLQQYLGVRKRR